MWGYSDFRVGRPFDYEEVAVVLDLPRYRRLGPVGWGHWHQGWLQAQSDEREDRLMRAHANILAALEMLVSDEPRIVRRSRTKVYPK
jgi:hypothetical protein